MAESAQKCGMVMSVSAQIIFAYMSDARAPAMDVHMAPQDAGMARSFCLILSPRGTACHGHALAMVANCSEEQLAALMEGQ